MKKRPPKAQEGLEVIRLWKPAQVQGALPLIRSIVATLREQWVEWRQWEYKLVQLAQRSGPPRRETLLAQKEASDEAARIKNLFQETLEELAELDVYCLDPLQGLALIPFQKGEELAWLVFDLFDSRGLVGWRFHQDSLDSRRSLAEVIKIPIPPLLTNAEDL